MKQVLWVVETVESKLRVRHFWDYCQNLYPFSQCLQWYWPKENEWIFDADGAPIWIQDSQRHTDSCLSLGYNMFSRDVWYFRILQSAWSEKWRPIFSENNRYSFDKTGRRDRLYSVETHSEQTDRHSSLYKYERSRTWRHTRFSVDILFLRRLTTWYSEG